LHFHLGLFLFSVNFLKDTGSFLDFFHTCGCPVVSVPYVNKTIFSPLIAFATLARSADYIYGALFLGYLFFFIDKFVFYFCQHHSLDCYSFAVSLFFFFFVLIGAIIACTYRVWCDVSIPGTFLMIKLAYLSAWTFIIYLCWKYPKPCLLTILKYTMLFC
jgi:hypothetical protein